MNPDQATTNFYRFFRQKTADGHIFNQDRSLVWPDAKLIEAEEKERDEWEQVLESLVEHYTGAGAPPRPQVTSLALLFQLRLCPPILMKDGNVESIWSNNRNTARLYPSRDGISVWKSFRRDVSCFQPTQPPGRDDFPPHQFYKLTDLYDIMETDIWSEEHCITTTLKRSLQRAQLAKVVGRRYKTMELPSFRLTEFSTDQTSAVCQARSTHNLRLPCHAEQVVAMYQAGYDNNDHQGWTNVCHPLAELVHHMVDQKCRYGALTSATRTYFVRIAMPPAADDTALSPIVEVSDAWYVGQGDYIKAWAYAHHQGCSANVNHESSVRWEAFGSCRTKKPTRREQENARASLQHAALLENVSYEDIEIISSLGYGRNGATFKARWNGIDVALKQFDLNKGGEENFQSELSAFAKLQEVWGELVPKPLFLSESWSGGVQFMGLQLGREYGPSDRVSRKDEQSVRKSIYERGIDLLDHDGRNFLLVPGEDGTERLVAIDLEDHDVVDSVQK